MRLLFKPVSYTHLDVYKRQAMVMALCMDLVPEEHRQRVRDDLRRKIADRDDHLDTGFLGTYYLCRTLTDNGMGDVAYTLLLNEDYPSWLYEVNMGATTVWERWNSVLPCLLYTSRCV